MADYRIQPMHVGSGRGSRRLYSPDDVYDIAIAEELSKCGLTSSAIGKALDEIRASGREVTLRELLREGSISTSKPLLVFIEKWEVMSLSEFSKKCPKPTEATGGIFILNFEAIVERVVARLATRRETLLRQKRKK